MARKDENDSAVKGSCHVKFLYALVVLLYCLVSLGFFWAHREISKIRRSTNLLQRDMVTSADAHDDYVVYEKGNFVEFVDKSLFDDLVKETQKQTDARSRHRRDETFAATYETEPASSRNKTEKVADSHHRRRHKSRTDKSKRKESVVQFHVLSGKPDDERKSSPKRNVDLTKKQRRYRRKLRRQLEKVREYYTSSSDGNDDGTMKDWVWMSSFARVPVS